MTQKPFRIKPLPTAQPRAFDQLELDRQNDAMSNLISPPKPKIVQPEEIPPIKEEPFRVKSNTNQAMSRLTAHLATDAIRGEANTIMGANAALKEGKFSVAEYILNRPLTITEITNRSITGAEYGPTSKATPMKELKRPVLVQREPTLTLSSSDKPDYNYTRDYIDREGDDAVDPFEDLDVLSGIRPRTRDNADDIREREVYWIKDAAHELAQAYGSGPKTTKYESYTINRLKQLYNDIVKVNKFYRSEQLDNYFAANRKADKKAIMLLLYQNMKRELLPMKDLDMPNLESVKEEIDGKGLKKKGHQRTPPLKLESFGKIAIDMTQLNKGVLSVVHPHNKHKVTGIKNTKLSTKAKNVVLSLLQGFEPNVKGLSQAEKELIAKVLRASKANVNINGKIPKVTSLNPKGSDDRAKMAESFKVLTGSIGARNDSVLLKNNLSILLNTMLEKNYITKKQALDATKAYIGNI